MASLPTKKNDDDLSESKSSKSLEFLELIGVLKHMRRKGWVLRNVPDPECIAAHMYRMSVMTFLIEPSQNINRLKCMELALIHDLAECIVGDITPICGVSTEEKHQREAKAMKQIIQLIPSNGTYMQNLFEEYEKQETAEAKLVKEFDRLDMIIQAFEYEKLENNNRLEEFYLSTQDKFSTPFILSIVEELMKQRNALIDSAEV